MIYYPICRQSSHCRWNPGIQSKKTGEYTIMPSVFCRFVGHEVVISDDVPDGCPFALEHAIIEQDVPEDFIARLSGERIEEDDET